MALRPEQIAALRDACEELAEPISQWLLQDIAQRIAEAGRMTSTAAYELYRTRALGESKAALKKYLREQLKLTRREVRRLFRQAARFSHDADFDRLGVARKGYSESFEQTVTAAAKLAGGELSNLTQTLGMVDRTGKALPLQKAYRSAMDFAFSQVFSGAADTDTAVAMATRKMAAQGVRVIDYESGVHTGLEAAVRRNMLSGLGLLDEQVTRQNHDELGCNGWEISAHANSAPDHEPIQGRQYSDADYEALNASLTRRIGTLNCGHLVSPVILGVNSPQYTEAELQKFREDNAKGVIYEGRHYTGYEATQKQRQLERAIWAQKNRILIAEAAGDAERLQTAQIRLRMLERHYREFSRAAGLRTRTQRAQVLMPQNAGSLYRGRTFQVHPPAPDRVPAARWGDISEEQAQNLQATHKQLLKSLAGGDPTHEAGGYIGKDFRLIQIRLGKEGRVRLSHPPSEAIGLAHTHPTGETFSIEDVSNFTLEPDLRIMTVAGNNGNVYILEKMENYDFSGLYHLLQDRVSHQSVDVSTSPELYIKFMEEFLHEAKRFGLGYWRFGAR